MSRRLPDLGEVISEVLGKGEARSVTRRARGTRTEPAALILAPLRSQNCVIGVLYLKRLGEDARFDEREFEIVRLFAAHVSIVPCRTR